MCGILKYLTENKGQTTFNFSPVRIFLNKMWSAPYLPLMEDGFDTFG